MIHTFNMLFEGYFYEHREELTNRRVFGLCKEVLDDIQGYNLPTYIIVTLSTQPIQGSTRIRIEYGADVVILKQKSIFRLTPSARSYFEQLFGKPRFKNFYLKIS